MKKVIKTPEEFENYEYGQMFLVMTPFGKDVAVYSIKMEENKYSITSNGKPCRSDGTKFIFAEDEGGSKDDKQMRYDLLGQMGGGSFSFVEGDTSIEQWEFEPIDENHPDYDDNLSQYGGMLGKMFKGLEKFEESENDDFSSILENMMKNLGK